MTQRASDIGELARGILSLGGEGRVSRVFPSSAYVRAADDFLVLLRGGPRSPLTVNFLASAVVSGLKPGEKCEFSPAGISAGEEVFPVEQARVFRTSLLRPRRVALPKPRELTAGASMLRSLYDVASEGPRLVDDPAFLRFADRVLAPVAGGEDEPAHDFRLYSELIGRGGGFTPAGDDFVGGFLSTFNFVARQRERDEVAVPLKKLLALTVPESAVILARGAEGYVDELMQELILKSTSEEQVTFHRELLSVARRGHTSGVDMSLGVLLAEAALSDPAGARGTLAACLGAISHA